MKVRLLLSVLVAITTVPAMADMQCPSVSQLAHPYPGAAWSVDAAAQRQGWYIFMSQSDEGVDFLINSNVSRLPESTDVFVDLLDYYQQPGSSYASAAAVCNYPVGQDAAGNDQRLILKNAHRVMVNPDFLTKNPFQSIPVAPGESAAFECATGGNGPQICRWW